jgi:small subunit ribosomal protein S3
MARKEMFKEGRTPLHTFRADIDYAQTAALTKVGLIGIKVWICRGEIYGKKDLAPDFTAVKENNRAHSTITRADSQREEKNNLSNSLI